MIDEFDEAFARLHRSPFEGNDPNDVFGQSSGMPTMPSSAIEDLGFTPEQLAMIRNGLYNGDLRTPPPDPDSELDDLTNKLPGWSYVKSGTSVTARWVDGSVVFSVAAGAPTGDSAYLEQVVPITSIGRSQVVHVFCAQFVEEEFDDDPVIEAQYLDVTGATTGTGGTWDVHGGWHDRVFTVNANGEAGVPSDGYLLRVRVGVTDAYTDAATYTLEHAYLEARWTLPGGVVLDDLSGDETPLSRDYLSQTQVYGVLSLGGADRTIKGIDSTGMRQGRILWICNMGSANNIVLSHADSNVGEEDRILCPNNSNLTIRPRGAVMLMWFGDTDTTRWRVMSQV